MKTVSLAIAGLMAAVMCAPAYAQQDTTHPVLLDFNMAPVVFDTGPSLVALNFCLTAQDDLSGLSSAHLQAHVVPPDSGPSFASQTVEFSGGSLTGTACGQLLLPQFAAYRLYGLQLFVTDGAANQADYRDPALVPFISPGGLDLCPIGPCEVRNRPAAGAPDDDGDGIPNDSDNCTNDPNPSQPDADLDLVGDVCDPFPNDPDNEQAQCESDLALCLANPIPDTDLDGETDSTDACLSTPAGENVDDSGCSLGEFCGNVDVTTRDGRRNCKRADWQNDEPRMHGLDRDCTVEFGTSGPGGDRCVPMPTAP